MKTLTRPETTSDRLPSPPATPIAGSRESSTHTLAEAVERASVAAVGLGLDDPRWEQAGPALTAFVDAARRAIDGSGSRIGADETASPVLRVRDLGRLAQMTAATRRSAPAEVARRLRSLQIAAHQ